ncbi:MAG: hypothetical protein WCP53_13375 [Verrucomicrobiota bacterium]
MKIIVEFERAEQHWSPDTGEQLNYLVFSFAGKEHRVECDEQDIIAAVRSAKGTAEEDLAVEPGGLEAHAAALGRVEEDYAEPYDEDGAEDPISPEQDELEREFGGDLSSVPTHSPFANVAEDPDEVEPAPRRAPPLAADAQRRQNIAATLAARPRSREKLAQEKVERLRAAARAPMRRSVEADEAGNPVVQQRPRQAHQEAPSRSSDDDDAFGQG